MDSITTTDRISRPLEGDERVAVASLHPMVREVMQAAIKRTRGLCFSGAVERPLQLQTLILNEGTTAAVLDTQGQVGEVLEAVEYLVGWKARVVVMHSQPDPEMAARFMRTGAKGFVANGSSGQIIQAIEATAKGIDYIDQATVVNLARERVHGPARSIAETLSNRELQVFMLIGEGLSTVGIADKLELSPKTIESYRRVIKQKLGIQTSSALSRAAFGYSAAPERPTQEAIPIQVTAQVQPPLRLTNQEE